MMNKIILLLILIFGFCKGDSDTTRFAVLSDGLNYVHSKDAKIAIKVWLNELAKENYDSEIIVDYYDEKEKVFKKFIDGDIVSLTLNTLQYLKNKEKLDKNIKDWYIFSTSQEEYIRYFLITKNSNKIKSIKDLKNRTLGIQEGEYLALLYLDHSFLEKKLPTHQKFLSSLMTYDNHSRSLMKLFFNKIDACIIPEYTWKMMVEMNPQIEKKLKVLDKSKKIFMPTISLISKSMDTKLSKLHHDNSLKLNSSVKGKQILTLLKCSVYKSIDKEYFTPIDSYYKEYLALKKRQSER